MDKLFSKTVFKDFVRFFNRCFIYRFYFKLYTYIYIIKSHYVRVSADADIEEVAKFISLKWLKKSPKIILPIITGLSHFKTWKNQKQLNKFKRGIIKVSENKIF